MTHAVVQIDAITFYALLLDAKGKPLHAEYLPHPCGGQVQRLHVGDKLLGPGNRVQVKQPRGDWIWASLTEVGEFTRSLRIQIDPPYRRPAIALKRSLAPTLFVR